ncbi:MAG: hypothetical protein J0G28_12365 [Afipia sp.]|nr:hypothetical protein [Afipia sp.]OJW63339.1 MAG: hypothetical protein BGO65_07815 [Afipia sp. 64-13]
MTAQTLTAFLDGLEQVAHAASTVEETYRREAAERFEVLAKERAYGFRRLNLMRSVVNAIAGSKDEDEAIVRGSAAFLQEVGWSSITEAQQEALEHFHPVIRAAWQVVESEDPEASFAKIGEELKGFEDWFGGARQSAFLSVLDREVVELPLVEVC